MSRYLTPSKIGLLALISLYTKSAVPTTATVPVLSFLVSHILPNASNSSSPSDRASIFSLSIEDFQRVTIIHASYIPGRTLWDLLLKILWEVNSIDALHVFFDSLALLLVKSREDLQKDREDEMIPTVDPDRTLLSRKSPLGAFVRRAQLEWTRMPFHDGITLWKNFIAFRDPTFSFWKRRNPTASKTSFDVNLDDGQFDMEDRLTRLIYGDLPVEHEENTGASADDAERAFEFQVTEMQRMGTRVPESIKIRLRNHLKTGVTAPKVSHYVKFLDSWKAGDYPSSFDNLHRYFDYTMHNRDRKFYQYALLNLAILQADFGCFNEAIDAMQEAISTARENRDMECLNFSLSWLYHFGKAHPREIREVQKRGVLGEDKEALTFLRAKAKETGMWSLLSTSMLSEARLALVNGDSVTLALENITKSSHLNITKNIVNLIGSQMMLQSAVSARLGLSTLAWSYENIFLKCYAAQSPAEDVLQYLCKSAYALAQRGRYIEAMARLDEADKDVLRNLKHRQYWMSYSGLLKLQRHLHKDDLIAAEHCLSQLHANVSNLEMFFTLSLLQVKLLTRQRDYSAAMSMLETLSARLNDEDADIYQRVKLMTMKARLFDMTGIPQKGFTIAVRAASIAYRARLLPTLWEAVGAIGRILISLKEFESSTKMLESIMPQVLECEDCDLAAQIFSFLADAHMGIAGQANEESLKRKEHINKALEYIGSSFDNFSRIKDVNGQCETMAKKAMILRLNGDTVLANDYSARYFEIKRAEKDNI